ncbi:DUF1080 domain-containing protein [uncultured Duncaniella sp.]|uniref:3-keto-disaccharide hydrolase n=1 Tax=uncultured Duncaniella sp. TaxID=2768039 RepID=UPI00261D5E70|nr:DUF1080 domain-containing protein [uncultured Duncaniella sp.]
MKKNMLLIAPAMLAMVACGGNKTATQPAEEETVTYTYLCDPMGVKMDSAAFVVDSAGYAVIFNGKDFTGWRGFGKDHVAEKWTIDSVGNMHFASGPGEGGDILFGHEFENFDIMFDWKVSEGANSGFFYLGQEVVDGQLIPYMFMSAPEYQILDNVNHPDAKLGVDGNRQSASLYDMIPANPQNSKPWGEWNSGRVVVNKGHVEHYQNGEKVVEYDIFTPEWTERLQGCKFSETAWPEAFVLMNTPHSGYVAFQDHGDEVWIRNVRIKELK